MKSKLTIFLFSIIPILESCNGKFKDGTSVWGKQLWLVPTVLLAGGAILVIIALISSNSGSNVIDAGATTNIEGGKIPVTKLAKFWGGAILMLIGLATWVGINYFRA